MMRTVLFFFGSSTGVGETGSFMTSSPYDMGCGKLFVQYELKNLIALYQAVCALSVRRNNHQIAIASSTISMIPITQLGMEKIGASRAKNLSNQLPYFLERLSANGTPKRKMSKFAVAANSMVFGMCFTIISFKLMVVRP